MDARRGLPSFLPAHEEEDGRENIVSDITQLIGWTPLIELKRIVAKEGLNVRLIGKMETYQPLSSVKDRSALRMIEDAEEKGLLTPGVSTLLAATSGNLGIGLMCTAIGKGYKFIAVVPAKYSLEKLILLRYLGAEISLTDPELGIQGMIDRVDKLKESIPDVYEIDQFTNLANPEAHFRGTGPELWKDTAGKVDIFVAAPGSGGTLTGTARYLKMKNPNVKIVCVEPMESAVVSGGEPGKHYIQGVGPGVIPENLDTTCIDEVVTVSSEEAMTQARRLATDEGLLVGISSGANLAACLKIASKQENEGKMIVTIFPSGGERYLSSKLFESVREECMNMTF
ncbi:bifunctional L-3-cyanoalanine synthase/cysteine synthase D1-like [Zingiber officinale]|uniref:bifunctional L-3-cyanoalanine synthase/cysteine synthase D1-like n=1 Tax=Zingiber officinale TaxID=94328 RepID=UPI001C4D28CC|nr:bifunctional L-3-cyanoalanine synthase/cysteine synthase D1-like [Zingiber officinale]